MEFLLGLSEKEFNDKAEISFNNITEGFNKYKNSIFSSNEKKKLEDVEKDFIGFIKDLYRLNKTLDNSGLIIDFYISKLNNEEYQRLFDSLDKIEQDILVNIKKSEYDTNYFQVIDEGILDFLVKLCTRELFFITFYFTKFPLTIWGNYDLKFPLFYNLESDIEEYKGILQRNNLTLI